MASVSAPTTQPGVNTLAAALDRLGLTMGGLIVLGAAAAGWAAARFVGGRGLYLLVYAGLAALAASYITARRRRAITARRSELARRAREGQTLDVDIFLSSAKRLGMFTVEEQLPEALGTPVRVSVEEVKPGEEWHHTYALRTARRGVYRIGPMRAIWDDPFGLARSHQVLLAATEIIVHPTTELVFDRPLTRQLEDPPIRPPKTKPWPSGFEFYGMRDYVPGDDLRRVVWKAVARTGKMLVREAEQGITDRINIVIDTDADWHRVGDPSDTFEAAVRVAASVGAGHLKNGFSVSLDCNGSTLAENLRGPRARILLLDELARVQQETEPLFKALDRLLLRNSRSAHNVIVTPRFDAQTAARAGLLINAGASVLVAAILWDESDPMSVHRATEIGAQVVRVKPGAALAGIFAHSLGAGIR